MSRKRRTVVLFIGSVLTVAGTTVLLWPGVPRLYRATILPVWPGQAFVPEALNDRGQVVGVMNPGRPPWHLVVWDRKNGPQDMGFAVCGDGDINNHGQIAGTAFDPNGVMQAFIMNSNGAVQFLGGPGGGSSQAKAVNDRGQVVGWSDYASAQHGFEGVHAFIWDRAGGMRDLGRAGGRASGATAVSEAGGVFGFFEYGGPGTYRSQRRPCYWNPDDAFSASGVETPSHDYFDMNGNGWIVGKHIFRNGESHVVLWHDYGGIKKLFPYDPEMDVFRSTWLVNDANQVVYTEEHHSRWEKYSTRLFPPRHDCYLWDPGRGRIALNRYLPGKTQRFEVCDLNNKGGILGIAHLKGGRLRFPILLEPIPEKWGERKKREL